MASSERARGHPQGRISSKRETACAAESSAWRPKPAQVASRPGFASSPPGDTHLWVEAGVVHPATRLVLPLADGHGVRLLGVSLLDPVGLRGVGLVSPGLVLDRINDIPAERDG